MITPTQKLSDAGLSIWLDDLSRARIESGDLAKLITNRNVVGVTTNPTIFAGALSNSESYAAQVKTLAQAKVNADQAVFIITTDDVRTACDIFRPVYDSSNGVDGRVSIEVSPELAHDTAKTVTQAKELWATVNRPNAMIKIPATIAGLQAITDVIAEGISVNVTLIFSLDRHNAVINAYLSGLEQAQAAGHDLSKIHSVASFFVSRVDTEINKRLKEISTPAALALSSKAGVANAQLAYRLFINKFAGLRWQTLATAGANRQRPLWASTGVKDPSLPDTLYVTELVAANVVNTMPEKTLAATFDHGVITGDTITSSYPQADKVLADLAAVGINYDQVTALLEREGVAKFIISWAELLETINTALKAAK